MWPFIYQTTSWALPTYVVLNSLVFCLGILWIYLRAPGRRLDQNSVLDVSLAVMLGGFVGARALHVFFEQPHFYWEHPSFVFRVWYGGFVYYGGAIVGGLAAWWVCKRKNYDFWAMGDLMAPVLAGGYAIGRLGCLAAGCCYGAPTTMPWGIHFPAGAEAPAGISLHPTQIYASLWELLVMFLLLYWDRRPSRGLSGTRATSRFGANGQLFGLWIALHGLGRAIIEQFRGDFRGPSLFNLSVSTWISGAAIIFGVYVVATFQALKKEEIKTHASTAV